MNQAKQRIVFEVPFNGDSELIQIYGDYKDRIAMVYGRAEDGYPQGRKTNKHPPITLENVFHQVETLRGWGIKFNYLLNGTSHGNREFDRQYRNRFVEHVKNLAVNGVEVVTIGNPFLLEVVANEVPEIEVFASVLMEIDCLARLKEISKLGARYVCLSKTLLKNFKALKSIYAHGGVKVEPVLLVNDPCLHHCAFTTYHNDTLSHLTGGATSCTSYCRLHCTRNFASDKRQIISASFIRPEDLRVYSGLGYSMFKLCDRKQTTEWIARAFQAYACEYYDGNLAEIMAPWNKREGHYDFPKILKKDEIESVGMDECRDQLRFMPYIDNRSLDDYLDYWRAQKQSGCRDEDCDSCEYCAKVATVALRGDPLRSRIVVRNIDVALEASTSINSRKKGGES